MDIDAMIDDNDDVQSWPFISPIKVENQTFRIGSLLKSQWWKTYRITVDITREIITLPPDESTPNPPIDRLTESFVHYLNKNSTPEDRQKMQTALAEQLEHNIELAKLVVDGTVSLIAGSRTWCTDIQVKIKYGFIISPNSRQARRMIAAITDQHGVTGTDKSAIKALERKQVSTLNEECAICTEEVPVGCQVVSMPCSHTFHKDCIEKWLKKSCSCPLCRFKMPSQITRSESKYRSDAEQADRDLELVMTEFGFVDY